MFLRFCHPVILHPVLPSSPSPTEPPSSNHGDACGSGPVLRQICGGRARLLRGEAKYSLQLPPSRFSRALLSICAGARLTPGLGGPGCSAPHPRHLPRGGGCCQPSAAARPSQPLRGSSASPGPTQPSHPQRGAAGRHGASWGAGTASSGESLFGHGTCLWSPRQGRIS